ncbi:alpha-galactosidase [Natronolimnobius baerhuensis]|uniref:Alpha-glucosidase/alpha-galactosidase n=1 Tax=Natronolimnobius baerhuensis TaxID=253108 RepID=A0A202E9Q0_9EURY|nr:alpha-galactosidase [Natronolimnobius baerhuensis]OVE84710.1 alpha-glucosidase/alpha-galactosidase [Natronolimnobius baerhuensis]
MVNVAFIGAGSLTFTQTLVRDILSFAELQETTVALMDIDAERLERIEAATNALIDEHDLPATVEATTDRREALTDADYVITTIQVGGVKPVEHEVEIPQRYGINQSVGDTLGPGGVFRAQRTIPTMLEIARDMEELCPDAPLLQHTNPMAMVCWALERETEIDVYGICHSVRGTAHDIANYVDVPVEDLEYWVAGINHMAWFLNLEYEGEDLYPDLYEAMDDDEIYAEDVVRFDVMDHFGAFITESSHHLSEYLPYFRHTQDEIDHLVERSAYDPDETEFEYSPVCWMPTGEYLEHWRARDPADAFDLDEIDLSLERSGEYAARIIHSIETDEVRRMNLNVPNDGRLITNLPDDALVEVPCLVDGTGVRPCSVGNLPPQLAALNRTNVNVQSLAVDAAVGADEDALRRAVKLDPLTSAVCTLEETDDLVDDLLEANAEYLPAFE